MRTANECLLGPNTRNCHHLSPLFELDREPYLWKTVLYNVKDHDLEEALRSLNVRLLHRPLCSWMTEMEEFDRAQSVLEVGCSTGENLYSLSRRFSSKHYLGIDSNKEKIQLARARYDYLENLEYRAISIEKLKGASGRQGRPSFDLIVVHVDLAAKKGRNGMESVRDARSLLAPGGRLVLLSTSIQWRIFQPQSVSQESDGHNLDLFHGDELEKSFKEVRENYPITSLMEKRALFAKILLEGELSYRKHQAEEKRELRQGDLKEHYIQLSHWLKSKESFAQVTLDYFLLNA